MSPDLNRMLQQGPWLALGHPYILERGILEEWWSTNILTNQGPPRQKEQSSLLMLSRLTGVAGHST